MIEAFNISEEFIKKEIDDVKKRLQDYRKLFFIKKLFKKRLIEEKNETSQKAAREEELKMEDKDLPVDIYQTDSEFIIVAPMAGVKTNGLKISINKETVLIEGEKEQPEIEKISKSVIYQETYWGPFSRQIILPEPIESTKATAYSKKGVLVLKIPKKKEG